LRFVEEMKITENKNGEMNEKMKKERGCAKGGRAAGPVPKACIAKLGQLQMGETIFVVFFIIIIIVFGLVFYSGAQQGKLKDDALEQSRLRLISQAHTISSWPELECSVVGIRDFDCIDLVKLNLLSGFMNESRREDSFAFRYYNDLLGRASITVTQIYPKPLPGSGVWVVYNNPANRTSNESVFNPVNLYDPFSGTYYFGVMELTVYG
jgi:hypothetical protein